MTHSDDEGLVLPPKIAPIHVVIVPIYKGEEQLNQISERALQLKKELEEKNIRVKYDNRDTHKPGWKFAEYEFKGVPVRIAIGPRDLENGTVEVARRDTKEKEILQQKDLAHKVENLLEKIQRNLYQKAIDYREEMTNKADSWEEFNQLIEKGGFVFAHWDGTPETEEEIKQQTKATIRCIPLNNKQEEGKCILTGKPSTQRVVFAKAY
jgi:prolyl-tRNA synthetase